eukprot:INCI20163.2.p1 GENE.INCI20163.2~~INCI20163.2.p1  ORF type:complete len:372 (-),score=74.63 INCI20163.2:309-1424(-)
MLRTTTTTAGTCLVALLAASPDAGGMLRVVEAQKPPLSTFRCTQGDCHSGFGVQTHDSGFKYAGQFVDGVRAGLGLETMPNGIRFAGNFADSVPNGLGVMLFPDTRVFAGEWKNDFPHGCGLMTEVSRPSPQDPDLLMEFRHTGVFQEGEIADPTADCHEEINKAHEAAKAAFAAAGNEAYEYTREGPRKPPTKEEQIEKLRIMQQGVLRLVSEVNAIAKTGKTDELEQLSNSHHTLEKAFVKAFYSQHALIADDFQPLFSRDALESVIFETMLEIDESAMDDVSVIEEQLALMEEHLENFPLEHEQNIRLLELHAEFTDEAAAAHKARGEEKEAAEAAGRAKELREQAQKIRDTVKLSVEDEGAVASSAE